MEMLTCKLTTTRIQLEISTGPSMSKITHPIVVLLIMCDVVVSCNDNLQLCRCLLEHGEHLLVLVFAADSGDVTRMEEDVDFGQWVAVGVRGALRAAGGVGVRV